MPFRARLRRVFGKSPPESSSEHSTSTPDSARTKKHPHEELNGRPDTYKPGEMPKPKYGGPTNKEHQKTLRAFRWPSDDWNPRRLSHQSQYSPTASKPTSRMNSYRRLSLNPKSRRTSHVDPAMRESVEEQADVSNVGLSMHHTYEHNGLLRNEPTAKIDGVIEMGSAEDSTTHLNGGPHLGSHEPHRSDFGRPFTANELQEALGQSIPPSSPPHAL